MAVYEEFGGAAVAAEEGVHIANALGPQKKTMILQNHGYVAPNDNITVLNLYGTDKFSLGSWPAVVRLVKL